MAAIEESLKEELARAFPQLLRWAARFETKWYDRDSLAGDTVIGFLKRPEAYVPERGSLRNFLFTALRNKALDFRKAYHREYRQRAREYLRSGLPRSSNADPAAEMVGGELRKKVERKLAEMPPRIAEAFRLFAFDGKDYEEIGRIWGTSSGNAKCAVHRARVRIREYLASAS